MRVAVVRTGTANLASVLAGLRRAGGEPYITEDPADVLREGRVILPGVGSFGAAMAELRSRGLDRALTERFRAGKPLAGFCLGMQLFFEASEESPGVRGLALLPGTIQKYPDSVRTPRLGWGEVRPDPGPGYLEPGWAAFANSYRLAGPPPGIRVAWADYAGPFAAACERPGLLLCQFHPELSGSWGTALLARWIMGSSAAEARPDTRLEKTPRDGRLENSGSNDSPARPPAEPLPGTRSVRVIPCLDVDAGRVVKGTRFLDLKDAGDPAELAARYEAEGADEIVLLDISAGIEGRATRADTVRRVRACLSIPLTVGGGIGSVQDAAALFDAGADKISVNSKAVRDPSILTELANRFGVQAVVIAVDAARRPDAAVRLPGSRPEGESPWEVTVDAGRTRTGLDPAAWARRAVDLGAGEVLLTGRDRDGTGSGYDLDLVSEVARAVPVPVVASGGAETPEQMYEGVAAGAAAVLAAGTFHFGRRTIREVKAFLAQKNVEVRP